MNRRKSARFITRIAAAALAATALSTSVPVAAQQERLTVRGTSVTLIPPPGFTASRTERGIENTSTGTTITISEAAPEAYAGLADPY